MIFTAQSPNTQKDDFRLALRILLKPRSYLKGSYPFKLKKWFRDFFKVENITLYDSARTALYYCLKEMGVGSGDEVVIQAFTCIAAVNPIKWLKAKPVYVDIDKDSLSLDLDDLAEKINKNTKVIIVQHTFGYPAKIDKIIKLAKTKNIKVIEDCAHTIGTEYKGVKLGKFGDAAIFSLGRDKAISGSFGGVLIANRNDLSEKLSKIEKGLKYPSKKWIARQVFYTIISYVIRNFYDLLSIGRIIHFISLKSGIILKATTKGEKKKSSKPNHVMSQMPNAFAEVALNQLKKLSSFNSKRKEYTRIYLKSLKEMDLKEVTVPDIKLHEGKFLIRFPILVEDREKLIEFASQNGVILGNWYDSPIAPKEVSLKNAGYIDGSCKSAERICKRIVNLPMHVNMEKEDALKVIEVIESYYGDKNN